MLKKMMFVLLGLVALAACQPPGQAAHSGRAQTALQVVAAETFLADIAQNVAGDRVKIESLMPIGVDPHGFEPTPTDVAKITDSQVLIVNGAGFEAFLDELLKSIELNRERIFITSPIKCFPPNNRLPKIDESKACKPYLEEQIRKIKPKIIIALGNYALQTLLDKKLTISRLHGEPQERNGIIIYPTFHPAAAMRFSKIRVLIEEDFTKLKDPLEKLKNI